VLAFVKNTSCIAVENIVLFPPNLMHVLYVGFVYL
jgi:hypothetical protein